MKFKLSNGAFWALFIGILAVGWALGPEEGASLTGVMLAQTILTGARATTGTGVDINQATRVVDMSDTIHLLDPNEAPLTAVTMKLRKAHTINPLFRWLEDDYLPSSDAINNTVDVPDEAGPSTITMTNGAYFRVNDVLKALATGEVLYVQSVSGNDITVARGVGSTATGVITNGTDLLIIGNGNPENATSRTIKSRQKDDLYNYTQIFRWPFGVSGTLNESDLYGGNDLAYQTRKNGIEHRIQLERAFLFGERSLSDGTSTVWGNDANYPTRLTGGVIERVINGGGTVATMDNLDIEKVEDFLRDGFRYGPARKMWFCSRQWISYLNQLAATSIETIPTSESFPLALTEYVSGHGKCYLVTHNLLEGTGANNVAYSGWSLLLDMDSIYYRYQQNRDTRVRTNIQAPSQDGREDEYHTEAGCMTIQAKNHAIYNNVTGLA